MLPVQNQGLRLRLGQNGPEVLFLLLILAFAAIALAHCRSYPAQSILPALSVLTIIVSLAIAGVAWALSARRNTQTVNYWDVAGGFMLIGISAAILADTDSLLIFR